MTIHNFSFDDFLEQVRYARSVLPSSIELSVNTGDLTAEECILLKNAGVSSAYHSIRLGESIDNGLEPRGRCDTIHNLINSGIKVYCGVEPIGPEHSPAEIASAYYYAHSIGCSRCSASPRISVDGTRFHHLPVISDRRLQQIRSALLLSLYGDLDNSVPFYGGFYGGFNCYYAEYSSSPKDRYEVSESSMQHTVEWCKCEAIRNGFRKAQISDGIIVAL